MNKSMARKVKEKMNINLSCEDIRTSPNAPQWKRLMEKAQPHPVRIPKPVKEKKKQTVFAQAPIPKVRGV